MSFNTINQNSEVLSGHMFMAHLDSNQASSSATPTDIYHQSILENDPPASSQSTAKDIQVTILRPENEVAEELSKPEDELPDHGNLGGEAGYPEINDQQDLPQNQLPDDTEIENDDDDFYQHISPWVSEEGGIYDPLNQGADPWVLDDDADYEEVEGEPVVAQPETGTGPSYGMIAGLALTTVAGIGLTILGRQAASIASGLANLSAISFIAGQVPV